MLEQVAFASARDRRLAGVLHHPGGAADTAVVVAHGMLSSKDSPKHLAVCERAAAAGALGLRFDFAGRGESEGAAADLTVTGECADLDGAVATVLARGARRVILVGSSLGGAVAVLNASRPHVVGLVTIAAPVVLPTAPRAGWGRTEATDERDLVRLADGEAIPATLFRDAPLHDIAAAAGMVGCPWLVLHGGRDAVVPPSDSARLAACGCRTRLVLHPGADHSFSDERRRRWLIETVGRFLAPLIAGRDPFRGRV